MKRARTERRRQRGRGEGIGAGRVRAGVGEGAPRSRFARDDEAVKPEVEEAHSAAPGGGARPASRSARGGRGGRRSPRGPSCTRRLCAARRGRRHEHDLAVVASPRSRRRARPGVSSVRRGRRGGGAGRAGHRRGAVDRAAWRRARAAGRPAVARRQRHGEAGGVEVGRRGRRRRRARAPQARGRSARRRAARPRAAAWPRRRATHGWRRTRSSTSAGVRPNSRSPCATPARRATSGARRVRHARHLDAHEAHAVQPEAPERADDDERGEGCRRARRRAVCRVIAAPPRRSGRRRSGARAGAPCPPGGCRPRPS